MLVTPAGVLESKESENLQENDWKGNSSQVKSVFNEMEN